jgi:hypothetical protein
MRIPDRCAYTRAALAVACLVFMLAGCGGGGGGSSNASTTPTSTTGTTNPTSIPPTTTEPATIPTSPPASNPTAPTSTSTATVQWSAPQSMTDGSVPTGIVGYRVYYGPTVTQMNTKVDILNPSVSTYVVEGLTPGTYYFAVTALHSSGGESDRSNAGLKIIS